MAHFASPRNPPVTITELPRKYAPPSGVKRWLRGIRHWASSVLRVAWADQGTRPGMRTASATPGVVNDDTIGCLSISHHLPNTNEIILIHHSRCGMPAFTGDLLKAGLEGDPAAEKLLGQTASSGTHDMECRRSCTIPGSRPAGRTRSRHADSSTTWTPASSRQSAILGRWGRSADRCAGGIAASSTAVAGE